MVAAWDAEYMRAPSPRRLLMLYLANDILQNSRRKVPRQRFLSGPTPRTQAWADRVAAAAGRQYCSGASCSVTRAAQRSTPAGVRKVRRGACTPQHVQRAGPGVCGGVLQGRAALAAAVAQGVR